MSGDSLHVYQNNPRKELAEFLPNHYSRVLEIGCGTGGFKETLGENLEVWGVEPNEEAANQATEKGYRTLIGLYDDVESQCPDNYFDLIICNDVIEHMVDHAHFLSIIKRKISKNGCLVGSIPNIRFYPILFKLVFKKEWEYTDEGVLDRTHLRFFTEKSLLRTLIEAGYDIEKFKGINNGGKFWFTFKSAIKCILIHGFFGLLNDTQYIQFGFRVKPAKTHIK